MQNCQAVLVGKINFKHFGKVFLRFSDRGLSFGMKYNIPIFVCLMSLLSCGKSTKAARYENYTQFCRIKGCGGVGWPPTNNFRKT